MESAASQTRPRVRDRCWATFNCTEFIHELSQSQLVLNHPEDVDELFQCYNSSIRSILDTLAPFGDVKQYTQRTSPWYDSECYVTKLKTRRLEREYRRRPDPTSKSLWQAQFNHQKKQKKFIDHWSFKISSSGRNQKTL